MAGPTKEFWDNRFAEGNTPWDRGASSPQLRTWIGSGLLKPCRILVPGCGSGYEVVELALAGGGPHVVAHFVVEDDEARGVALLLCEVAERGSQEARIIDFGCLVRGEAHRGRGVEQQRELGIGLPVVALQIAALGAGEDVPVDMA